MQGTSAQTEAVDVNGRTALFYAARFAQMEIAEVRNLIRSVLCANDATPVSVGRASASKRWRMTSKSHTSPNMRIASLGATHLPLTSVIAWLSSEIQDGTRASSGAWRLMFNCTSETLNVTSQTCVDLTPVRRYARRAHGDTADCCSTRTTSRQCVCQSHLHKSRAAFGRTKGFCYFEFPSQYVPYDVEGLLTGPSNACNSAFSLLPESRTPCWFRLNAFLLRPRLSRTSPFTCNSAL